jgi:hypothetical protein|tara:strand:+ start:581 stop:862 length:282 start_codon:yes stop_codon:yes gene_type:complete
MEFSLQRPSNFKQLSLDDKVINIRRRIHDLQVTIRLRSKLSNAEPDQSQQPTNNHYQQSSNRVEQSNDALPNQRANELDSLKAKLMQKPTNPQ